MDFSQATTLDTSGLLCPEPVMMLHNAIRDVAVGDIVEVIAARDGLILKLPVELRPLTRRKIQISATRELSKNEREIFRKWIRTSDES